MLVVVVVVRPYVARIASWRLLSTPGSMTWYSHLPLLYVLATAHSERLWIFNWQFTLAHHCVFFYLYSTLWHLCLYESTEFQPKTNLYVHDPA